MLKHRVERPATRPVAYIPATNVAKIKEPALLISIKGKHGDRPAIDEKKHHVFKLDFDVGDWAVECDANLQESQVEQLLDWLTVYKDSDRHLYIHCTEGRIRSYTIATLLRHEGMVYIDRTNPLLGPGQSMDRNTCNVFNAYIEKLEAAEEAEEEKAAAAEPVPGTASSAGEDTVV